MRLHGNPEHQELYQNNELHPEVLRCLPFSKKKQQTIMSENQISITSNLQLQS